MQLNTKYYEAKKKLNREFKSEIKKIVRFISRRPSTFEPSVSYFDFKSISVVGSKIKFYNKNRVKYLKKPPSIIFLKHTSNIKCSHCKIQYTRPYKYGSKLVFNHPKKNLYYNYNFCFHCNYNMIISSYIDMCRDNTHHVYVKNFHIITHTINNCRYY
jgi:hypothetical protein